MASAKARGLVSLRSNEGDPSVGGAGNDPSVAGNDIIEETGDLFEETMRKKSMKAINAAFLL